MRFIDPLITLRFMGGSLAVHVIMAIYSMSEYNLRSKELAFTNIGSCKGEYDKFQVEDIIIMGISHIICASILLIQSLMDKVGIKQRFLRQLLIVI